LSNPTESLVSNATPLIYLAKADRLAILKSTTDRVHIPDAVFKEVVVQGKALKEQDAFRVEQAVSEGWIIVRKVKKILSLPISIHRGEREVISLAMEIGAKTVLMDDMKGRAACELAGLRPRGTLWVILEAVRMRQLDFDAFLKTLEVMTTSGYYLNEEVYLRAIQMARQWTIDRHG
jgi:predicted nucleic acid-binding protein